MHRHTLVTFLSITALLAACQRSEVVNAAPDTRLIQYSTHGADSAVFLLKGVQVEVAEPIKRALSVHQTRPPSTLQIEIGDAPPLRAAEDPDCRFWISGQPLYVGGDHFWIGDSDFGPVASGDRVRIADDGVTIGSELRGALPAR